MGTWKWLALPVHAGGYGNPPRPLSDNDSETGQPRSMLSIEHPLPIHGLDSGAVVGTA